MQSRRACRLATFRAWLLRSPDMVLRIRKRWLRAALNKLPALAGRGPVFFPVIPADGRILFAQRDRADYGFLSNFHPAPFMIDGERWPGVEWFYQAGKSTDDEYRRQIRAAPHAGKAKRLGDSRIGDPRIAKASRFRKRPELLRPDWEAVKLDIMREGVRAKFRQNGDLASMLLATGQAPLIEDIPGDRFWGVGADGTGENMLGKLLMAARDELRHGLSPA